MRNDLTMTDDRWRSKRPVIAGVITLVLLVAGLGSWSAFAELAGAVIAAGELRKEGNRQVVQHPDGGIVAEIQVREGDAVQAGDLLFRLDETRPRAELAVIDVQRDEALATTARLTAERDGLDDLPIEKRLKARLDDNPALLSVVRGQKKLFQARRESLKAEQTQLSTRIEQAKRRIDGAHDQIEALETQSSLIAEEIAAQQALFDKGLGTAAPLMALKREAANIDGETAALRSTIAQTVSEIAAIEVERLQLEGARREEAIDRLRSLHADIAELDQRRIAIADQLARMDIRAPRSGVVHALEVHARQSVIQPAEPLLYIVPEDEALIVDVEIAPTDIDNVHPGQAVELRFPTFNLKTNPSIEGSVQNISADRHIDEQSGESFYSIEITIDDTSLASITDTIQLLPGMPVEAYLMTESQTPISYLTKPLTDQLTQALR